MTTKTTSVPELNQRRHKAVQLRLAGKTLASVSETVGLSTPTIVAAMKAFESGGWDAVNVKPRGRPKQSDNHSAASMEQLGQSLLDTASADKRLWTTTDVRQWLQVSHDKAVSEQTAASYLQQWDLAPDNAHRMHRHSTQIDLRRWFDAEHKSFIADARRESRTVLWVGARHKEHGLVQLYAHSLRGRCSWHLMPTTSDTNLHQRFVESLKAQCPQGLSIVLLPSASFLSTALNKDVFINAPAILEQAARPASRTRVTNKGAEPSSTVAPNNNASAALTHLQRLEAEAIHILREAVAEADNPVLLHSLGKDSAVMMHLARKAFYPGTPTFPMLHIDTGWKFQEMYRYREQIAALEDVELLVHSNQDGIDKGVNPFTHGSELHTDIMETQALIQALGKYAFDVAIGGGRRDEAPSRAKERIFSFRSRQHQWQPKKQRPEPWNIYNCRKHKGESIRVFPLSNWTEFDIWQYIRQEAIPVTSLYFAAERPVVERDGNLLMIDDDRFLLKNNETVRHKMVRFRTLGCYPLTAAIESTATTATDILREMSQLTTSERFGRQTDHDASASIEKKKIQGYF